MILGTNMFLGVGFLNRTALSHALQISLCSLVFFRVAANTKSMTSYWVILIPVGPLMPSHIVTSCELQHIQYRQAVRSSKTGPPLKITSFVSPVFSFMPIECLIYFFLARFFHYKSGCSNFSLSDQFLYITEITLCRPKSKGKWKVHCGADICVSAGPIPASWNPR